MEALKRPRKSPWREILSDEGKKWLDEFEEIKRKAAEEGGLLFETEEEAVKSLEDESS